MEEGNENSENDNANYIQELHDLVDNILDRKRSTVQGRADAFADFSRIAKFHYVEEQIRPRVKELVAAFLKSIKLETSEQESVLAFQALEVLAVTAYDSAVYELAEPQLTRSVRDSTSRSIKGAAIYCLGSCTMFGGASEDNIYGQMTSFLDIVASDGQSIDAADDPESVMAAVRAWGLLATEMDDLEAESEEAVQIFVDQLGGDHTDVQIAAGENIALLYEKSYSLQTDYNDGQDSSEEDELELGDGNSDAGGPRLVKRYDAYHNTHEITEDLQSLATIHSKRISKKEKKSLHSSFLSILSTVEDPRRGPMYSTAIDQDTGREYGSRAVVRMGDGAVDVDRWWKWIRLSWIRRILRGGFSVHFSQGNRAVLDNLPVSFRLNTLQQDDKAGARKAMKARSDARKFAIHDEEL